MNVPQDTVADIKRRRDYAAAAALVAQERAARYPTLTVDNAADVLEWQERRLAELLGYFIT